MVYALGSHIHIAVVSFLLMQPSGGGRRLVAKKREMQYPFLGDLLIYARCSECCPKIEIAICHPPLSY